MNLILHYVFIHFNLVTIPCRYGFDLHTQSQPRLRLDLEQTQMYILISYIYLLVFAVSWPDTQYHITMETRQIFANLTRV